MKLLVLPGSIRKESYNLKLAAIAAEHARQAGVEVDLVTPADLAPIPLYNGDLEAAEGLPAAVKALKQRFIAAQIGDSQRRQAVLLRAEQVARAAELEIHFGQFETVRCRGESI